MESKKSLKFFNFRPIFFLFVLALTCVYFASKCFENTLYLFFFIIPLGFLIYLICKRKFILLGVSVLLLGFLSTFTFVYISNFFDDSFADKTYVISGKVESVEPTNEVNLHLVILQNVTATSEDGAVKNLSSKTLVFVYGLEDEFDARTSKLSRIVFTSKIRGVKLLENGKINYSTIRQNIKYHATSSASKIVNLGDDKNVLEKFREYNRTLLISQFGEEMGNIAYASLYTDKTELDKNVASSLNLLGVSHILSVSGLHVAMLVLLLNFFLNKSRLKNWQKFLITALFLLGFCILCSFSPSVERASIMALVVLLAKVFYREYDLINSLSFAGIIILVLSPMSAFSYSFLMSVSSVFGIAFLHKVFYRLTSKNGLIMSIYSATSVTISAQIGLLPNLCMFGSIPTWSILGNIIIVPLFALFYNLLFVVNLLCLVLPVLKFAYILPKAILHVILFLTSLLTKLPHPYITLYEMSFLQIVLFYSTLFVASKLLVLKLKFKVILSSTFVAILLLSTIFVNLPINSKNSITFYDSSKSASCVLTFSNGNTYILNPDLKTISTFISTNKFAKISGIIFLEELIDDEINKNLPSLEKFSPTLFLASPAQNAKLNRLNFNLVNLSNESMVVDELFYLLPYYKNNNLLALTLKFGTTTACIFNAQNQFDANFAKDFNFQIDYAKIINAENTSTTFTLLTSHLFFANSPTQTFALD